MQVVDQRAGCEPFNVDGVAVPESRYARELTA